MSKVAYAPRLELNLYRAFVEGDGFFPSLPFTGDAEVSYCFDQSTNSDDLRMEFTIENFGFMYPNFGYMNFILHNMDRDGPIGFAREAAGPNATPYLVGVELKAGYQNDDTLTTIFQGVATEILDSYIQPNNQTRFFCQYCPNNNSNSFRFGPQTTLISALNEILETFSFQGDCPIQSVDQSNFSPPEAALVPLFGSRVRRGNRKALSVSGTFSDCIYQISSAWDVYIPISATSIQIHDITDNLSVFIPSYVNRNSIIINYTSGLIGSPTFFWQTSQVSFQTVLMPNFSFNSLFILQDVGPTLQGPTGTAINIANSRVKDAVGYPKTFTHRGDTRGRDWYTEVTGLVANSLFDDPLLDAFDRQVPDFINCQ